MITAKKFTDGGLVVHKIEGNKSAWFDKNGKMLDAEYRNSIGIHHPIKPQSTKWKLIESNYQTYLKFVEK